nr:FtsQ-type POTRA domain-containing protein [Leucobacter edaphi]
MIAGGAVLALALFVLIGVFTPLTAVKEIRIEGASAVPQAEVNDALKRFEGVPLALVNDAEVHGALEKFPRIQRYAVERIPPSTLVVRIEERTPVMGIKEGGSFAVVDAAGVVLSTSKEPPKGVPVGSGSLVDRNSVAFRTSATALRDIPAKLREQIATVHATSGQDVTFGLASGVSVVWGDASDSRYKALVLDTTMKSLAQQKRPVSKIDVSSPGAPVFR